MGDMGDDIVKSFGKWMLIIVFAAISAAVIIALLT